MRRRAALRLRARARARVAASAAPRYLESARDGELEDAARGHRLRPPERDRVVSSAAVQGDVARRRRRATLIVRADKKAAGRRPFLVEEEHARRDVAVDRVREVES